MLLIEDKEQSSLISNNLNPQEVNIHLYKRNMGEYYSWILCSEISNGEDLIKNWNLIVEDAALFIQAELKSAIERYNLYLIFFVECAIPNDLKMTIEQDKYSSRKIVVNESMPRSLKKINERIEKLLFTIKFADNQQQDNEKNLLKNWLESTDKNFYNLYSKYGSKTHNFLDEYASFFPIEKEGK